MNRFRTKRRAKDDTSAPEQSAMPSFKSFRRGKKSTEEQPKPEFDLASALPSDDNFRTSLLMTNLSARFSMLREQDDPNSKIGKASDDSVLFPKRQSKLGDFGFNAGHGGLTDISEVESIKAPFLRGQVDSYISDDADSTHGGIMNRGKPTEGNVLFGGRQKIYKIPVGGAASTKSSGMAGRALYEDDVALSAFQLWRQAERKRQSLEAESDDSTPINADAEDSELPRAESPMLVGYDRKRETSSTMSSASVVARYSTAATSVNSQPASSIRESQPGSSVVSSTNSTPAAERSVTRTRRLYEQALAQDKHGQQSSPFARIDSFSRQRPVGARSPDPAQASPSAASLAFPDRFGERRPILAKASAPNLRSPSPATTASSSNTLDLGVKAPGQPANKSVFGGAPPLSPPISETGDNAVLAVQPNDLGKATALGVFQKPSEPYDESKYAQRQLQLQSGRETPESRARAGSSASFATSWRSRSSSSMHRQALDIKAESAVRVEPTVKEEYTNESSLIFNEPDSSPKVPSNTSSGPQVVLQRPADTDHPAFRGAGLPTPVTPSDLEMSQAAEVADTQDTANAASRHPSPPDSPTLGPTSGLSGMVRQHLRSESNASSVSGNSPQAAGLEERFALETGDSTVTGVSLKSSPWDRHGHRREDAVNGSNISEYTKKDAFKGTDASHPNSGHALADDPESEPDEFASRLEDARRRVRERLTSYVETDSSREGSPLRSTDGQKDALGQLPQPNVLGLGILKPKSSRSSLIDRSLSKVGGQAKAMKMLGIGAATTATSSNADELSSEEKDRETPTPSVDQDPTECDHKPDQQPSTADIESEAESKPMKDKEDENLHPGLRAFRQARRELQRRKELEVLARHQASQMSSAGLQRAYEEDSPPRPEPGARQRTPSRERRPMPAVYQHRAPSTEPAHGQGSTSNPGSRHASTERDRSGSEASHSRMENRPTRLRNSSAPYDAQQQQHQQALNKGLRPFMLRSPGPPGTDMRRSPIMPPQGYPGSATSSAGPSPKYFDRSRSAANLSVQPSRSGYDPQSGQPSPIAPLGDPLVSPSAGPTANKPRVNRRPSAPQSPAFGTPTSTVNDFNRRTVNKYEISEPTFIMSTTRVPTVSLPQSSSDGKTRSRSGTTTGQNAPPLPPINPLRKRGPGDEQDKLPSTDTTLMDDEGSRTRAIQNLLGNGDEHRSPSTYWVNGSQQNAAGQYIVAGPPASRTVLTPRLQPSNSSLPGGMI